MREAGDIVLFSEASASQAPVRAAQSKKCRWHFAALKPKLIEIVDDVTGAGNAPVKGGVKRKGALKRLNA